MTIPLDDLPPLWRSVLKVLAVKVVALEQAHEDVREAHETAIEELLGETPALRQAFEEIRHQKLEAGRQVFDQMSEAEIQDRGEAEIEEALARAVQAIERNRIESMPVS